MISYAQNFEDVILARALRSVDHGFYVDIGAWHPDRHSVTRHFYEEGWCGINVEPGRTYFGHLERQRPRDVNLNVVVSDRPGKVAFHEAPHSGLSGADEGVIETARRHGIEPSTYDVEAITLADLLARHAGEREIHFLKIDVEGHEPLVLRSGDWARFRPWIVVVEAISPSGDSTHEAFDADLRAQRYAFAYFDGLNRFYVRAESAELLQHFALPPNVFDGIARFPDDRLGHAMERIYSLCRRAYRRIAR